MERERGTPEAAGPPPDNKTGVIHRVKMCSQTKTVSCPKKGQKDVPKVWTGYYPPSGLSRHQMSDELQ